MIEKELNKVLSKKYSFDRVENENLLRVLFLTQELLKKYDLMDTEIEFRSHYDYSGTCNEGGEIITLQLNFCINEDIEEVRNTILHEIAHALVGTHCGHNIVWQNKARELGVTWEINYRE